MAKIICPNKQYTGVSASVPFAAGIGETDDPHLIDWFKKNGYTVEGEQAGSPFDGMSIDDLKAYAAEKNINIGNATSQAGIIKKIQEAEKQT